MTTEPQTTIHEPSYQLLNYAKQTQFSKSTKKRKPFYDKLL